MKKQLLILFIILLLFTSGCKKGTHGIYEINIVAHLLENNSVGNEWDIIYSYNEENIENGYKILKPLTVNDNISIKINITEIDEYPDIANGEISISIQKEEKKTTNITIIENKGRYKSNIAVWKIEISSKCVKKLYLP